MILNDEIFIIDYDNFKFDLNIYSGKYDSLGDEIYVFVKAIQNNVEKKFDVLAVPCDRTFVVAPEQVEEFKNLKPNAEVRQQTEEMAEEFRVNNITGKGPVLEKTRPNKK